MRGVEEGGGETVPWEMIASEKKCELHRHLEGSVPAATVYRLQQEGVINSHFTSAQDVLDNVVIKEPISDFDEFIKRFGHLHRVFTEGGPRATQAATRDTILDASRNEGIDTLELRFSPHFMAGPQEAEMSSSTGWGEYPSSWDDHMRGLLAGREQAYQHLGMERPRIGLTVIVSRNYGPGSGMWTAAFARRWREHVTGFDFAAHEQVNGWGVAEFAESALAAAQMGLPLTVHIGEGTSSTNIAQVLDTYPNVRRLGHATKLVEDVALVQRVADAGVVVECCPTSNYVMGCVASIAAHPLPQLLAAGVRACVSTDDATLFGTDLNLEWQACVREMRLTRRQLLEMNSMGYRSAFL